MKAVIKVVIFAAIVIWTTNFVVNAAAGRQQHNNEQPFDHSQCQYPDRNTNPPNGCDNSDPACPETIKFGYDCTPPTVGTPEVEKPMSQNISYEEVTEVAGK